MQSKDNNRGALYCCGHCQLFLRKFKWQPGHNKDTREVTVHLPNNEELLHHDSVFPPVWTLRKAWEAAVKRARLEDFRFHDLRHTAASSLAMNGATPSEIAEVTGHKT